MTASTRFLGGSPLAVAFRLILLSILVGVVLAAIGFDPWNILRSIRAAVPAHLGSRLRRHQLAVALLPARRRDRDPDLAAVADVRRAARAIERRRGRHFVGFLNKVTTAQVFAIAGPAMVANLTTPLIGIVSTIAIGRLGDADAARRRRHRVGDFRLPVLAVCLPAHEHRGVHRAGAWRRRDAGIAGAADTRACGRGFDRNGADRCCRSRSPRSC